MPVETKISFSDGSASDTLRKLSEDSRKHLSDLIEDEEDEVTSSLPGRPRTYRKTSTSSGSMASMDALWEKHPRRLSEAGLRRSSDHSVVLTEDTDSFIIGERVWVGGTKSGQIAYIGETQFAPGDWAGIVLDDPIGKNDGSVAGVRYFQCAEKRGVFSRLTRLTRVPLPGHGHGAHDASPVSDAGSVFERPPSGAGYARQTRRTLSPNGSVRSAISSKMNTSVSTTTTGELRIGDRVIVSSSRGSKAGILRYVGLTDFAPGVWAGVELDDPIGKNDGSVDGKSYFECAPRFGLFAPIGKVSRSPSNRKPGQCAIHSNGRQTPIRRSNSRESLTSLSTSIASSRITATGRAGVQRIGAPRATSTPVAAKNALQELLREKQHHLERLMRERELERAEVAKVSIQAERAESALHTLQKEAQQIATEKSALAEELERLKQQLEDERQKVEDLMFRNEEENINKEEFIKYKEQMEKEKAARELRIRDLEAEAALQAARAEANASALRALEEQRSAEAAAIAEQHKEELTAAQTLSSELQKLLDEAYALLKEKECEKDSLGKSMSEELTRVKAEYEKALNDAKTKIAIAQTEFETQLSVVSGKLKLAESKLEAEKLNLERLDKESSQTIADLNVKVSQLQATVDDKTLELNKVMGSSKEHEVNLNKEITKLKMELSAKVLDVEQLEDSRKKEQAVCQSLQEEITRVKEEYSAKVNEYESILNEVSQQNEKSKSEILSLQQSLQAKTKEYEKLLSDSSCTSESTEKLITEFKQTIHERDKEIIKLKNDYEEANANFNIKHSKIAEEHSKEIEDKNTKIEHLMKELESQKSALNQSKVDFESLNSQFMLNTNELKSLHEENERLKQTVNELTQINNDMKAKISAMELEIGELKRQYNSAVEKCEEIQKSKDKIESEYMNLTGQATDSNEQYNKLSQHLKETEKELTDMKDKYRETVNNHGRIEQEMKQTLFKLQEDYAAERTQLVRAASESSEKIETADQKIKELEAQGLELMNKLRDFNASNDKLSDENSILKKEIEAMKIKEHELNTEYESMRKKLEVEMDKYKEEISILKAEGATSEVKLIEKVDQLTEAQNDLNNKLEEARKHEDSLQTILNDTTAQLNAQKAHFEKEIAQAQGQLISVTEECNKLKLEENKLKDQLQEKQNTVKDLTLKLEMLEVDLKSNVEIINAKDHQLAQISEELQKTSENKKDLEDKLNNLAQELTSAKQKYESLLSNSSAEGSMLKEQIGQLETIKVEMSALGQEKTVLESKHKDVEAELLKLKEEHKQITEKLNDNVNINEELKKTLAEKDILLKSFNEKTESESKKLKSLEEEVSRMKQDIVNKDITIQEKESHLAKLNETLQSGSNETQQMIAQLQKENIQLSDKYKSENEHLSSTIKSLQQRVTEQEQQFAELQQTKEKITQLQEQLTKSDSDIKQLTNINEGQKSNYEELNKQLQIQYDDYKKEAKRAKHDLKARLDQNEKELQESREQIKTQIEKQNQLQQKLSEAEKTVLELSQKLELISVQQSSNAEKDSVLEKLTLELQATRKSSAETLKNSETIVNTLKEEIDSKIKELKQRDEMLAKLQKELENQKVKAELAEREKVLLQKQFSENNKNIRNNNDNKAVGGLGQGDASDKLQEEKQMIDGQVSFLNSVIVDMQRKNEQLVARVQALEAGDSTEAPVFFNNGRKPRAAPRLFCDICDVFDAHDTEDCPRQTTDAAPPAAARKPPPAPRPYCDICEVFGHSTENCDEEETF